MTQDAQVVVNQDDSADVLLAKGGDERAFERLYRKHSPRIYNLARRMLGEDHAADGTQTAFIRCWTKLETFRGEAQFSTWLHRLAVNVFLGERGTLGTQRQRFLEDDAALEVLPSTQGMSVGFSMDFEDAVQKLPTGMRTVFVLYDVEGYTHEEIGQQLGIATGSSKAALHRARMALRKHLER
ncbi:MAG TPA: RNA polymerase sigma factor [Gemmatimonadales bacterium]